MNKVFKTVWSKTLLTWVPVAEISKAHRGCACGRSRRKLRAGTQSPLRNIAAAAVAALSGAVFLAIPVAHATSYTVTQILSDGSTVSLLPGDTITTNNASGVNVTNGTYTLASGNNVTVNGTAGNIYGLSANGANARIKLDNNTITNNSSGASSYGLYAVNGGTITGTGSTAVKTSGASSFGLYASGANANNQGIITVSGAADITTTGANSHGAAIDGVGADILLNGDSHITTTGAGSHGVQVINKATKTFNGAIGNILPAITVSGDGSAAVDASGAGSVLTLAGNTALSMSMTAGPNTWGAKAEAGGVVNFQGNSNSLGTALWAIPAAPASR